MEFRISLGNFLIAYSEALDLICPKLVDHHKDVAYWAGLMGDQMGLSRERTEVLVQAALLHDIGIFTSKGRLDTLSFEFEMEKAHAEVGAMLLEYTPYFQEHGEIVRHHHDVYEDLANDEAVPLESQIIFLLDRVAVMIDKTQRILLQRRPVITMIQEQKGKKFNPVVVEAFEKIMHQDNLWMDIQNRRDEVIRHYLGDKELVMNGEELACFGKLFVRAIDFRSRHTAAHSVAVSRIVERLTELMGFTEEVRKMMMLTGYFHDIGKVVVPSEILDKPGVVTWDEMEIIREHPYYTQRILAELKGLGRYSDIAAQHHERLDGTGYPYHLKREQLYPESMILTVADIFTALVETRSYRRGLGKDETLKVMEFYQRNKSLDGTMVDLVKEHYEAFSDEIAQVYAELFSEYQLFDERVNNLGLH